jgi:Fe-Mn family superoxide dismutase
MRFELDNLPYEPDALEPHISATTVDLHYHKHHGGYMKKLADEIQGKPLAADLSLEQLVRTAPDDSSVFRNAAQVWNHTFYWNSLAPEGGGRPDGTIHDLIVRDFGSVERFKRAYAEVAAAEFGSGWAWLVADQAGRLNVLSTSDADNPMRDDQQPLLTLDVWEHAYYLDYRNDRARYIEACLENLLNWQFAQANLELTAVRTDASALQNDTSLVAPGRG